MLKEKGKIIPAITALMLLALVFPALAAADPITITTSSPLTKANLNNSYNTQINASGGTPINAYSYDDYYNVYYYVCSGYSWNLSAGSLPPGLSLSQSNGSGVWYDNAYAYHNGLLPGQAILSGTPTVSGTYTFTLRAVDYLGAAITRQFSLTVDSLNITTNSLPGGNKNMPYSTTLNATGGTTPYTWSITAGNLPAGLSLAASTGIISGTPTVTGTSNFTVKVTDANNNNISKGLSIYLAPELYFTTASPAPQANLQMSYETIINVTGGTPFNAWSVDEMGWYYRTFVCSGYMWTVSAGNLPPGLSLNSSNGSFPSYGTWYDDGQGAHNGVLPGQAKLSGTPTVSGTYTFTLRAVDYLGAIITRQFSLTVDPLHIISSSLPGGNMNMPYSTTLNATGGTTPYTWSITAGSLPSGLSLAAATGIISGTPTVTGTSNFTVKVTDANNDNVSRSLSISLAPEFYFTTAANLTPANFNTGYTAQVNASGGTPINAYSYDNYYNVYYYICSGYSWSLSAGSLPPGLSLTQNHGSDVWYDNGHAAHNGFLPGQAILSGTPTQYGVYTFTLTALDYLGVPITRNFTLTVEPIVITTGSLHYARKDVNYSTTLTASGGPTPYTWSITAGSLPAGLSLGASTGILAGTPTVTGTYTFTIRVTGSDSTFMEKQFSLEIRNTWDMLTGGDHKGADWTLANGDLIGGEHYNIGKFTISQGNTASIQTGSGMRISANSIEINGVFNANSRGVLELAAVNDLKISGTVNLRDLSYGGTDSTSTQGGDAGNGCSGAGGGGYGGAGGAGGGTAPGAGGGTRGTNNDNDIDEGSKGGNVPVVPYVDPYGGMGGKGLFSAGKSIVISGTIDARGSDGQPGCTYQPGGGAGGGSGGGILISGTSVSIADTAQLYANGGNGGNASYGQHGGGGGGAGRIKILAWTSLTTPSLSVLTNLVHLAGGAGGTPDGQPGHNNAIYIHQPQTGGCPKCGCDECKIPHDSNTDAVSGNLNFDLDLTHIIPANGRPHNFRIYYNSLADETAGPLGPKWTHSFNYRITPVVTGQELFYTDGTGKTIPFTDPNGDNVYESSPAYGVYAVITDTGSGYVLKTKGRTIYNFNSSGQWTNIVDTNGQAITATYTGGLLTAVTLPDGTRTIAITYTNNLISQITDPASQVTAFTYTGGLLTGVSQNSGAWAWAYTYKAGTSLLETRTEPYSDANKINVITYGYNDQNKQTSVTKKINGTNKTLTIAYDSAKGTATVTDWAGNVSSGTYNALLDTWNGKTDELGNATANNYSAPAVGRNLLSTTNPKGATSTYTYNNRGDVLTATDALSRTTTFAYADPVNPDLPTSITDALGVRTLMAYNNAGEVISRTAAAGTAVEQLTQYEYYASIDASYPTWIGKLKSETRYPDGPANQQTKLVTGYVYDARGYLYQRIVDAAGLNIIYQTDYNILGQMTTSYCPRSLQPAFVYTYDYRGNQLTIRTYINPTTSYLTTLTYDLMDRLTQKIEDDGGLNLVTVNTYDNLGRLLSTAIDPVGLNIVTQNVYDELGRLTQSTDPEGAVTQYAYYANGWLKSVTRQLNATDYAVTRYFYDANGNQTQIIDPESHTTQRTYTVLNQLLTNTDAEGNTTTYNYNEVGLPIWTQDARLNITYTFYDELRRVKYVRTAQDNITTANVYDKAGRTVQVIGPWYDANQNGLVDYGESRLLTQYAQPTTHNSTYDKADRVIESWVNSHPKSLYEYDKADNQTKVTDPEGAVTTSVYDRCHELTLTTVDPTGLNIQTKHIYDKVGRQTEVHAAFGTALETVTYSVYDNANRLTQQYTGSTTYATNYTYNKRGQVLTTTDANGNVTQNQYDLGGRLLKVINAKGNYTRYAYNKDGLRTDVWYVRNSSEVNTHYTYYRNHLLYQTDYPGFNGARNVTTNYYDGNGNLIQTQDARLTTKNYTFDNNNRLILKTYPDLSTVAYSYDARSNLLTMLDANTDTVNDYDDLSRLTTVTNKKYPYPYKVIQYAYYEDGLRKQMTEPEGGVVGYTYDKAKRLQLLTRNSVTQATYEYNALGLRTKLTEGNGAYAENTYDNITRWLTLVSNKNSTGTVLSSFAYTLDKVGNRTSMTLNNGAVISYTFDAIYQLTQEQRTVNNPYTVSWTYDEVGNRLTQTKNQQLTTYTYNDANQLITTVEGGITTTNYTFDANGNQTGKTIGANTWSWGYDYENRQINYTDPITAANNATYLYNVGGSRIQKYVNGVATKFIYDGANIIADYNSSNNLQASYVTPFLDQNLLIITGGNTYYYLADGLGSIRNLIDTNQIVQNSYDYFAFGEILNQVEVVPQRYKFTAREFDAESQTNYYRARNQDPQTGRFLSADPMEYDAGINLYSYVQNNVVNRVDHFGLDSTTGSSGEKECLVCGPEVKQWFYDEIINHLNWSFAQSKILDQDPESNIGMRGVRFALYAKSLLYKEIDFSQAVPECPSGKKEGTPCYTSVQLCGTCIERSELGNLMFGITGRAWRFNFLQLGIAAKFAKGFKNDWDIAAGRIGWDMEDDILTNDAKHLKDVDAMCKFFTTNSRWSRIQDPSVVNCGTCNSCLPNNAVHSEKPTAENPPEKYQWWFPKEIMTPREKPKKPYEPQPEGPEG